MRHLVLACGLAVALTGSAVARPGPGPHTVLATSADYACTPTCTLTFQVRYGESYLHLVAKPTSGLGTVGLDVKTATGLVHVCGDTKSGALSIDGLKFVSVSPSLVDPVCNPSGAVVTGRVFAYFSARDVTLSDAIATATPDPDRDVYGAA